MESYHVAIYENLRLLTRIFPNLDMESRLQEGMFKKPNTRGMQSVFRSLIMILNAEYCRQHVPWPISFQSDNYKFRTSVVNFIKAECPDFEAPQLLPSLLNKAEGEKFVRLLSDFVSYVTKTIIKRKNFAVLNLPSAAVDEDESFRVFEAVTNSIYQKIHNERQSLITEYRELMRNCSQIINESNTEKKNLQKDIHQKRERSLCELQHLLSYTNINDKSIVEFALSDYETEANELRRNYFLIRQHIHRLLMKTEHLVRLISLLQNYEGDLIGSEYLRSHLTNDLAHKINVPLTTILSAMFVHSENGLLINLKEFVHYGYLLLRSWQQRFLNSQKLQQHHEVHEEAEHILKNVTKKADELKNLRKALNEIILDCETKIPVLESRSEKNTNVNEDWVETMRMVLSMKNYCPRLSNQFPEESVLLDIPKTLESDEDIINRLQMIMKKIPSSKN